MLLTNEYEVAAPVDTLWELLNDVERIAPYVPGFELTEVEGDTYRGTIKVKVGAVTVSYNAEIEVLERDAAAKVVVMEVAGRERRGPGSVNAKVTSRLSPAPAGASIALETDVEVTGKVAQFGSGVLGDVSSALLARFVKGLEGHLGEAAAAPANGNGAAPAAAPRPRPERDDVVDIGAVAGKAMMARVGVPAAAGALGFLLMAAAFVLGRKSV